MGEGKNIIIDLKDSTYAHRFEPGTRIHAESMERCLRMIGEELGKARRYSLSDDNSVMLDHYYDTIGVFGDRGSGKTSFMVSLLEECRKRFDDALVLRMIDPTLIERKKPIELCVLALINEQVEDKIRQSECSAAGCHVSDRKRWQDVKKRLATGVIAIDDVGKSYGDALWNDEDYVVNTGFKKVRQTNEFERNIREMLTLGLDILGKKAFILAFDDIDVDVAQGWKVLEAIRRYFSDPRIITMVTGNLKLYGMIVRNKLSKDLNINDPSLRAAMANELESQYMLKLLRPEKRVNLVPLRILVNKGFSIKFQAETKDGHRTMTPDLTYCLILAATGIRGSSAQNSYVEFLMSMSLRSQINFVKESLENDDDLPSLSVFASRLYAVGIDLNILSNVVGLTNIAILDYLMSGGSLPDMYLLLPTLSDKDKNSNVVALSFMACGNFKKHPHLMFDYLLRIGYLRNVIMPITDTGKTRTLIRYAGWNQLISLKNNVGLTMAYMSSVGNSALKAHIMLYGLEKNVREGQDKSENALDQLLKGHGDDMVRLLAMFPFVRIASNHNNEGRNFYSLFTLLGAISEILKCETEGDMVSAINDLRLFRAYLEPDDGAESSDEVEVDTDISTDSKHMSELARRMFMWKKEYHDKMVPPYTLGRIATRVYNAAINVSAQMVGDGMNLLVCNFINACIIEESKLCLTPSGQISLNNGNMRTDTKVLRDNLGRREIIEDLLFSKWIMMCPMLICFVDSDVYDKIRSYMMNNKDLGERENVFDLLNKIRIKKSKKEEITQRKKTTFSGAADRIEEMISHLHEGGITDDDINKRIIDAKTDDAWSYIRQKRIFKAVQKKSVYNFQLNYNRLKGVKPAKTEDKE